MRVPTSCGPRLAVDPAHVGVGTISVSISGVNRPDWCPGVPGAGDADYHLLFRSRATFSFTWPPLKQSLLDIPDRPLWGHLNVTQMSQVLREGWMKDHILVSRWRIFYCITFWINQSWTITYWKFILSNPTNILWQLKNNFSLSGKSK